MFGLEYRLGVDLLACVWGLVSDGVIFCWEIRHLIYPSPRAYMLMSILRLGTPLLWKMFFAWFPALHHEVIFSLVWVPQWSVKEAIPISGTSGRTSGVGL
jgi:hypothetical protein